MFDYQYSESGRSGSMPLSTMFGLALGEFVYFSFLIFNPGQVLLRYLVVYA